MADEFAQNNYPTVSPEKANLRMVLEKAGYTFPAALANRIQDTDGDKYFSDEEIKAGLRLDYQEKNPQASNDDIKSSVNFQMKKINTVMNESGYYNRVPFYGVKLPPASPWW